MSPRDTHAGASPWARQTVKAILGGIESGAITTCPHVPLPPPGIAALALTYGKWACPPCWPELGKLPATCDRCRGPLGPGEDVRALIDGVWLTYSLCRPCVKADRQITLTDADKP